LAERLAELALYADALDDFNRVAVGNNRQTSPRLRIMRTTDSELDEPTIAERIWQVIAMIPRGRVATYGQVAELAGLPGNARRVGRLLSQLPSGSRIPWHRVINASGAISLPRRSDGFARQRSRLVREGVKVSSTGRIALRQFRWNP
jgi:methylated-DNA-protein-cysteine methyltransferase-like protein